MNEQNQTGQSALLKGVRVLDFSQYLAGPTTTRMLVELGADVIKVERAKGGDPSRGFPLIKEGQSLYFIQQNRGKKSLCINFDQPEGLAIVKALAAKADVIVENYGPGVMEKRGLDYASLSKVNPGLVMCSISAFGRKSTLSHLTGYDYIAQAFSGLMHMTGEPDGPPQPVGISIADGVAGVNAFGAIGHALFYRERTGQGQHIDISMVDTLYHMLSVEVQLYTGSDGAIKPQRFGVHSSGSCPQGTFKGPKGWIVLMVHDRQWPGFCRAIGKPEWADDPRFASLSLRAQHREEIISTIEAWMQTFPDDEAVLEVLRQHRVPAAPVLSIEETVNHPYFTDRNMVRAVSDRILGNVTIPGFPIKFSEMSTDLEVETSFLGEHNEEILTDHLGWQAGAIPELYTKNVLYRDETARERVATAAPAERTVG